MKIEVQNTSNWNEKRIIFLLNKYKAKSLQMVTVAMKLKDTYSSEEKL